jgi:hypothetical protein
MINAQQYYNERKRHPGYVSIYAESKQYHEFSLNFVS